MSEDLVRLFRLRLLCSSREERPCPFKRQVELLTVLPFKLHAAQMYRVFRTGFPQNFAFADVYPLERGRLSLVVENDRRVLSGRPNV